MQEAKEKKLKKYEADLTNQHKNSLNANSRLKNLNKQLESNLRENEALMSHLKHLKSKSSKYVDPIMIIDKFSQDYIDKKSGQVIKDDSKEHTATKRKERER